MAIKLFGKTIHTPPAKEEGLVWLREASDEDDEKAELKKEDNHESIDPNLSDEAMSCDANFSATNEEKKNQNTPKANGSIHKQLRKTPIILPCPRCKSMDTKFCYFNNYKVNQPRHFCKQCQRYWTAGGSIRNVPIGAGRRKNKNFAVNRHNRVPDCALDVLRESSCLLKPNGTLLSFGSEAPICQSMASVLDLVERKMVMTKSENETNKATNSDCYGLHLCLSGSNRPKPCSHIPPQSTPSKIQWLLF